MKEDRVELLVIDAHEERTIVRSVHGECSYSPPKPNVWQGKHRLTKDQWWAKCNALNTALCLCKTDWICFLDDRCVVMPGFLNAIRDAVGGRYIMAGAYEKRINMKVENGVIVEPSEVIGKDCREPHGRRPCVGEWLFGCCLAGPVEWFLRVNGWPEILCDSMSFEDVIMGKILANNHYPMLYDPRAKIIEDRTPSELGTPMRRTAKEKYPNDTGDKAHEALRRVVGMKRSENPFGDIRELRARVQNGEPFPVLNKPETDWFDGMPVADFDKIP